MKKAYPFLVVLLWAVSCNQPSRRETESTTQAPEYREAVEFIAPVGQSIDSLFGGILVEGQEIYSWKNHSIVFGEIDNLKELESRVAVLIPDVQIKEYLKPLYAYDKTLHCDDTSVVTEWKDYLLTANLVEDTIKQQEYVAYHDTQFEEWPEIAQGFCNAEFQQLLVYKTGRQLLLVISIPADKTLDELNPKTVENNPRVDDWNAIMGQYQEGIPGTAEGEVWVFLE